ncbi:MAG: PhzF family phenazine biosynthesis protein [Tissierellia bacterium]|nr:PhzF family phenazine biosynthesis protein [Tissierellia bacterium]
MDINIYQVDAFTDKIFGGNPAGIVISPRNLTEHMMQKIAEEMNLSETAFVTPFSRDSFLVKFFTPVCEIDLCGHATIAAFYALGEMGYIEGIDNGIMKAYQETNLGQLPVELYYINGKIDKVFMEQDKPKSLSTLKDLDRLAEAMGIRVEDIGIEGTTAYPEIISTGVPDIILPIKTKEVLDKIKIDKDKLSKVSEDLNVIGVHAFYLPKIGSEYAYTRNFAPYVGIDEEAATGTSNGALIYYLKKNNLIQGNDLVSYQGEQMNRPSTIYCKIEERDGEYIIKVGGKAKIVMSGILSL